MDYKLALGGFFINFIFLRSVPNPDNSFIGVIGDGV